ncbi:alpha/beta hydrolase fold domain-containing protein [Streptomyces sp. NPDC014805]|uniref:alpha/beta hydrolase n=1 Tax=Streptomyces sp. NPDC014805 TaxID=3364919 RepID=UPI0036F76F48
MSAAQGFQRSLVLCDALVTGRLVRESVNAVGVVLVPRNEVLTSRRALAQEAGCAVASVEYRRVGAGGGWPTTLTDTARAVDFLPSLANAALGAQIDLSCVAYAGHSAGGHLALWAAARHRLPTGPGPPAEPTLLPPFEESSRSPRRLTSRQPMLSAAVAARSPPSSAATRPPSRNATPSQPERPSTRYPVLVTST